jgi:hypothetical protein
MPTRLRQHAASALRTRRRRHSLRTGVFVRATPIPTTAQILALAHLRRGLALPEVLFAALIPSEQELGRRIFGEAWPPPANSEERPR